MCDTYSLTFSSGDTDEIRDLLLNSWAAVKITLFAIETPDNLKNQENRDALNVVIEGFEQVEGKWRSQLYEDVMAGSKHNPISGRDDPLKWDKLELQLKVLRGTLDVICGVREDLSAEKNNCGIESDVEDQSSEEAAQEPTASSNRQFGRTGSPSALSVVAQIGDSVQDDGSEPEEDSKGPTTRT
ncbi:hypothetical protein F5883DRAFT_589296 [Diaporthe sp. PMI_573]|nr:hypothetical protein F5883DRAFT_589296 [Diaporthaceae sp. PMI_573]